MIPFFRPNMGAAEKYWLEGYKSARIPWYDGGRGE